MTRLVHRIALAVTAVLALTVAPACNSDTDGQTPSEGRVENNKPEGGVPEGEDTDPDSGGAESSTTTAPTDSGGGGGVTGGDEGGTY